MFSKCGDVGDGFAAKRRISNGIPMSEEIDSGVDEALKMASEGETVASPIVGIFATGLGTRGV